jgi:DNA-binding transcriptional MerR regulator
MRRGFTTTEAADLSGLSARQVRYMDEKDVVPPSVRGREGRGSTALYSVDDVVRLGILSEIRETVHADLPVSTAKSVTDALNRTSDAEVLFVDSSGASTGKTADVQSQTRRVRTSVVVHVADVREQIIGRIRKAGLEAYGDLVS